MSSPYNPFALSSNLHNHNLRVVPFNFSLIKKLPSFSNSIFIGSNSRIFHSSSKKGLSCFCCSMAVEVDSVSQIELQGTLNSSRAYWPSKYILAWNVDVGNGSYYLFASKTAALRVTNDGIEGYDVKIKLDKVNGGLPAHVTEKFPHIRGYSAFRAPANLDVESLLKCQLAVAAFSGDGACRNVTGLQLPGVIDELYSYDGPLGAVFSEDSISLNLWAPTAQAVNASIYRDPLGGEPLQTVQLNESSGVWIVVGPRSWEGCYYVYEVTVYHHTTLRIEKCFAIDPYARGVSADVKRTLLADIKSESLKPEGWDNLADEKPHLLSPSDISIYELHIRDFSAYDLTVSPDLRGGYLAFTSQDSAGVNHLKKLSAAGLTHVHLLPSFQFAEVDDDKKKWKFVDTKMLETLPPDSEEQQAQITAIRDEDGYNWGYNPVLWGTPKGSYATDPNGPSRIIEFRKMVQALNHIGLRVVLDVVYNHLNSSGPSDVNSVLDKIVPGYYLRRDNDGAIENSTCINDTASEHYMVERLILDDLKHWSVNYKVDGFRFDLMGHIMKHTMVKATSMLQGLSKTQDGVEGSSIYIYGEGWDFGEVANNARGVNASQMNLSGTGIGSFNDRIRDAVLGGGPFGPLLQQGYVTGLSLQPNDNDHGGKANADRMLAVAKDHIQVGLAANLRDFMLTNCDGRQVKGSEVYTYGGSPVGYAMQPIETINYVSAHDNETLFDIVSLKTATYTSLDERCRVNHLATSIIALTQGIPFFHAGDELLRSKSLDRDSYNSGDWFNRLDFSYNTNNWGVGLPPKDQNQNNWPIIKQRLENPSYKPDKSHIIAAVENFTNLLQIRYSSPLFRLRSAKDIEDRVRFHNNVPSWIPGLIAMSIEDGHAGASGLSQIDPKFQYIVVMINVQPTETKFTNPDFRAKSLQLHPVLSMSGDTIVKESKYEPSTGCFTVPPKTTAVFVEPRHV
ncbi:pullulanase 1, chloroplastic-like [Chenopodium quinoa]|uniref:pullulanase 1, chloroplastic-like n=1 Tax=Chenopodium quinoa TaxID=63459 RepID=UPI000B7882D0|nr:pullulanase 1, chloroplastic-like [Chenopodium quinoa]